MEGNEIVPIGKAYFGFTDEELKQLDKWVRNNTVAAFGPVREVSKELVFEVAFDSAQQSGRHKSGIALRFPRINRIRWDKPANEAATLDDMQVFLSATFESRHVPRRLRTQDHPARSRNGRCAVAREDFENRRPPARRNHFAMGGGAVRKPPPGEMGLGTNVPVVKPPKGWGAGSKKPDPDDEH